MDHWKYPMLRPGSLLLVWRWKILKFRWINQVVCPNTPHGWHTALIPETPSLMPCVALSQTPWPYDRCCHSGSFWETRWGKQTESETRFFSCSVTYLDKALTSFLSSGFTICSLVMVMGWEQSCLLCDSQGRYRVPWAPISGTGTSPIFFPIWSWQ